MNLLIHAVLNFTIRSQTLANIHEIFQNISILRNGVGSSFSTPCTAPALFFKWHLVMFCIINRNLMGHFEFL